MKIESVCLSNNSFVSADLDAIIKWLIMTVGAGVVENTNAWADPQCKWSMWRNNFTHSTVFEFKDRNDALLFKLTFS